MGAKHIVLHGGSMGCAIVLKFLTNLPLADRVSATVEAPPIHRRIDIDHRDLDCQLTVTCVQELSYAPVKHQNGRADCSSCSG